MIFFVKQLVESMNYKIDIKAQKEGVGTVGLICLEGLDSL